MLGLLLKGKRTLVSANDKHGLRVLSAAPYEADKQEFMKIYFLNSTQNSDFLLQSFTFYFLWCECLNKHSVFSFIPKYI